MIDYARHLSTARLLGRHIPCTIVVPGVEAPSSLPARCRDLPAQTGRSLCVAISIGGWLEEGFQGRRTTRSASPIVNQIPHYHAWRRYWRCCRRNPCVCCRVAVLPCCLVASLPSGWRSPNDDGALLFLPRLGCCRLSVLFSISLTHLHPSATTIVYTVHHLPQLACPILLSSLHGHGF